MPEFYPQSHALGTVLHYDESGTDLPGISIHADVVSNSSLALSQADGALLKATDRLCFILARVGLSSGI